MTKGPENSTPFSEADFELLRSHIQALAFLPGGVGLPATCWHWQPREFIRQFRMCVWLSRAEFERIYPDGEYPVGPLASIGKSPSSIRDGFRNEINLVCRKYSIVSPARRTHFLGQGAVESLFLSLMVEGAASFSLNPHHPSFHDESGGYYNPPAGGYLDYLNGNLGNIEAGDGPKFRGRGMKQLTGRENYSKYWVYRGWLDPQSFKAPWWNPSRPDKAPVIPDPQRLSVNAYNSIDAGGWYWEAGARPNGFRSINSCIVPGDFSDQAIETVTRAINGGINGLVQRKTQTRRVRKIIDDVL